MGTLYLVSTPIGNLEDITLRALRILKEVDLIACEDTRHTRRLLDHFGIKKPTLSYHEHNEKSRTDDLINRLKGGEAIAIVSDAGTPGISDPAYRIVKTAIENNIKVEPVPGATAAIAALTASGLATDSFLFVGFLPPKKNARKERLSELQNSAATLVFYEAPHRIEETLRDAEEVLGDRNAVLARELTKLYEEFIRGKLSYIRDLITSQKPRGEMALVIEGADTDNSVIDNSLSLKEQVELLMKNIGMDRMEAIKTAARSKGLSKRDAYKMMLDD